MASGKGRCAGCERTGALSLINEHVIQCPDWAALYRREPARALTPLQEYARWQAEDRETEREDRKAAAMADTDARRDKSVSRFKRPDPLED